MLAHEARPLAPGADAMDAERLSGGHGQGQGGTEDLSSAFALRAIQYDHSAPSALNHERNHES
jgi:hypothetical protein